MKGSTCLLMLLFTVTGLKGQDLAETYLQKWKQFYPSKAMNVGFRPSIFHYEDRSIDAIDRWVAFNQEVLAVVSDPGAAYTINASINARLLRVQAQSEVDQWQVLKFAENDLSNYLRLLSRALSPVVSADYLLPVEKSRLICQRLEAIDMLAQAAQKNLKSITQLQLEESDKAFQGLMNELSQIETTMQAAGIRVNCEGFETQRIRALEEVNGLNDCVQQSLSQSVRESSDILGKQEYSRQLALYTDSDLTPEKLAEMALNEIQLVRGLMEEVATTYLSRAYAGEKLPDSFTERLDKALEDMGKDVPLNGADYERFWNELAERAIAFVREKDLGTLPEHQTLSIQSAPESAGPAARIGWVGSAPPFDPNPWTTLYLPSIPDTLPVQEQKDFWSSFNKPFNRMIVIHELFPGHYMQLKISRETAHPIRLLFPFGVYIEGWATLCERVALDEGWDSGNHMTMLAHLRKRLENANRAYTSVMVHTQGWTREQVMEFSTGTSMVAPQFAKSLWFRLMRSPMQLTSYFLGRAQFSELLDHEKERLGNDFDLTLFMDTIMKAGPIPIDEFYEIFKSQ